MTLNAQNGNLLFTQQASKVGAGVFNPASTAYTWRSFPTSTLTGGIQQMMQPMPLEVNGGLVPTGVFKSGVAYALEASMIPRLKSNFGHLLKMTMGQAATTAATDLYGNAVATYNSHWFTYKSDAGDLPWFAVRKSIEGSTNADDWAEFGYDCKVANLRFAVQATNKIAASISILGRGIKMERDYSTFTVNGTGTAAAVEDYQTTAEAGNATIKINNVAYPLLGMTVEISNVLTGQEEFIVGSYYMDDIIPKARALTVRAVVKIPDTNFFQGVLTGSVSGTTWSPAPWLHDTNTNYALDASFKTAIYATGTTPYELRLVANRVAWAAGSPPLQAGNILTQEIVGTVLQPSSSGSLAQKDTYFAIGLGNLATSNPYNS